MSFIENHPTLQIYRTEEFGLCSLTTECRLQMFSAVLDPFASLVKRQGYMLVSLCWSKIDRRVKEIVHGFWNPLIWCPCWNLMKALLITFTLKNLGHELDLLSRIGETKAYGFICFHPLVLLLSQYVHLIDFELNKALGRRSSSNFFRFRVQ